MGTITGLFTAVAATVVLSAGAVGVSFAADAEQVTAAVAKTHDSELGHAGRLCRRADRE